MSNKYFCALKSIFSAPDYEFSLFSLIEIFFQHLFSCKSNTIHQNDWRWKTHGISKKRFQSHDPCNLRRSWTRSNARCIIKTKTSRCSSRSQIMRTHSNKAKARGVSVSMNDQTSFRKLHESFESFSEISFLSVTPFRKHRKLLKNRRTLEIYILIESLELLNRAFIMLIEINFQISQKKFKISKRKKALNKKLHIHLASLELSRTCMCWGKLPRRKAFSISTAPIVRLRQTIEKREKFSPR